MENGNYTIEKRACGLARSIRDSPRLDFMRRVPNYKFLFDALVRSPLSLPYCISCKNEIRKKQKFESIGELVDFALGCCNGFIKPWQVRGEIGSLVSMLWERRPKYMLEIGTASGGTLFIFCNSAALDATIISLDLGGYSLSQWWLYKSFAKKGQKLHLLRCDSHKEQSLEAARSLLKGNMLDFLFIDGDHSYEGVKRDFEMYSHLVRKGGIIALHDIAVHPPEQHCNVNLFWDELKKTHKTKEFIENKEQGWGGIGVVFV